MTTYAAQYRRYEGRWHTTARGTTREALRPFLAALRTVHRARIARGSVEIRIAEIPEGGSYDHG